MQPIFLCRLAVIFLLTGVVSSQSWAEPLVIAMVGPQPDMIRAEGAERVLSYEEGQNSITLIRIGPRVGVSGKSPFGKDQIEDFQQYDLAAVFGLPWGWQEPM
ncbi:MAG: hypothetical protein OEY86_19100, partial [Nitrospira sp.]|nr:hypothetical protein [Nitrospira sp.]